MGRSRFKFQENHYPYFITSSVINGIPLFSDPELADIILQSLQFIQEQKGAILYGYVIMENHIHAVLESDDISRVIQSFKSYTAKKIIQSLEERERLLLLKRLRFNKKKHKIQSEYQVWQEGVHPKQIDSTKKMISCLEYIHYNPVKVGYIDDPVHWRYSSARKYQNLPGLIGITIFDG
ncbi:MAG: transposase [Balneolaceae bacterium]|nr:transposase [Balneolaceae bacterium]MBO6547144.1 transposase [Balneolaceae bacterium]MBO6647908.1 transposase [Balneolaceae bacterium]